MILLLLFWLAVTLVSMTASYLKLILVPIGKLELAVWKKLPVGTDLSVICSSSAPRLLGNFACANGYISDQVLFQRYR